LQSGKTLWDGLCFKYQEGVDSVKSFVAQWNNLKQYVDTERHAEIAQLLAIQLKDAIWWRNACLLYFQTFSKMEYPAGVEKSDHDLNYYKSIRIINAPGN
jgi:alpha-glucuronidase